MARLLYDTNMSSKNARLHYTIRCTSRIAHVHFHLHTHSHSHTNTHTQSHTGTVINHMYIVVIRPHIDPPVLHTRRLLVFSLTAEFVLQS